MKNLICRNCGNIVSVVKESGVPLMCCGKKMEEIEAVEVEAILKADQEAIPVCDLKPLDVNAKENYIVCKCNSVSYFEILDALQNHSKIEQLLDIFEDVKNTTHCSTGCGGCYEKVLAIISEAMAK